MGAARRLTLTFDNGPDPVGTARVLERLAERGVGATFFPVGTQILRPHARELLHAVADAGHRIGNHSMTHRIPLGEDPRPDAVRREIVDMQDLLGDLAGEQKLFRPFGKGGLLGKHLLGKAAVSHLIAARYTVVLWNCVPGDWVDPGGWPARALSDLEQRDWTVLVLHDVVPEAMELLPTFLDDVAARGIEVTAEFPDECVPIRDGVVRSDLAAITADSA